MLIMEMDPSTDPALAADLHSLQQAAYRAEAELIADDRIPPLHESISELASRPLRWVGAFAGDTAARVVRTDLLGAIAWEIGGDRIVIDRLMVRADAQRHRVATRLVSTVIQHADGLPVMVSTGKGNAPARALYEQMGFLPTGDREVIPGLWVSDFELRGSL